MVKFRTTNVDDSIVHGVMKLVKPPIIRQTIFLAKDEMMEVQELDHEVVKFNTVKTFTRL